MDHRIVQRSTRARVIRHIVRTLLVNGLAPLLVYVLVHRFASSFTALVCSAVPPMLESAWSVIRRGRPDVMAVLVLGGIALGLLMMTLGGSPRLLLVRESLISGIVGVVFLASLALRRPLVFYLARELMAGDASARTDRWEEFWHVAPFRHGMRWMTLAWGAGLALEAVVRVSLALTVGIATFLVISPCVQYGILGTLIAWNVWFSRRMRRSVRAVLEALPEAPAG